MELVPPAGDTHVVSLVVLGPIFGVVGRVAQACPQRARQLLGTAAHAAC